MNSYEKYHESFSLQLNPLIVENTIGIINNETLEEVTRSINSAFHNESYMNGVEIGIAYCLFAIRNIDETSNCLINKLLEVLK